MNEKDEVVEQTGLATTFVNKLKEPFSLSEFQKSVFLSRND